MRRDHRLQLFLAYTFALLVLGIVITVRVRLISIPLERDEGEFAYAGQLLLQGILPFKSVYNMKMPGIYAAYAAVMAIFGTSTEAIHLGLMIVNLITAALVFQLGRKNSGLITGVVAAACYGLMSLHFSVQGVFAHATHFVVMFALAGILVVLKGIEDLRKDILLAGGLLLGTGSMMKQHGVVFILYAGFVLVRSIFSRPDVPPAEKARAIGAFSTGALIPFSVTCVVLWRAGLFDAFWFWTVSYASRYVAMEPVSSGISHLRHNLMAIVSAWEALWALAAVGLLFPPKKCQPGGGRGALGWLAAFSFISILPGLHFRPHYFVLVLPAVSLLAGAGVTRLCGPASADHDPQRPEQTQDDAGPPPGGQKLASFRGGGALRYHAALAVLLIVFSYSLVRNDGYYFKDAPENVSNKIYPAQFFPESVKIADYLRRHSRKTDTIAVVGSEPQIYFYADRHSATGFIYMYPLMETHEYALTMQQRMAREIEAARPVFIAFFSSQPSWVVRPASERWIFDWIARYREKYRTVGIVDFIAPERVIYVWGDGAAGYQPVSPIWCMILRRVDESGQGGSTPRPALIQ